MPWDAFQETIPGPASHKETKRNCHLSPGAAGGAWEGQRRGGGRFTPEVQEKEGGPAEAFIAGG